MPLERPTDLLVPNAVSFIVQKLLIHDDRQGNKKAPDILYIRDTLELFGGALDNLRVVWNDQLRPEMPAKTATMAIKTSKTLFAQVTDTIREAARIPQDRRLSRERIRAACEYGLHEIFGNAG